VCFGTRRPCARTWRRGRGETPCRSARPFGGEGTRNDRRALGRTGHGAMTRVRTPVARMSASDIRDVSPRISLRSCGLRLRCAGCLTIEYWGMPAREAPRRHCERSEAIQRARSASKKAAFAAGSDWIASSHLDRRFAPLQILLAMTVGASSCLDGCYHPCGCASCTSASGRLTSISTNAIGCGEPFITSCSTPAGRE
jgi:hypothetical protein